MSTVIIGEGASVKLLDAHTGTGVVTNPDGKRTFWKPIARDKTFHFHSSGTYEVKVMVSNFNDPQASGTPWHTLATITGTGSQVLVDTGVWKYISLDITANSGALSLCVGT